MLDRIAVLKILRRDIKQFLEIVHQRELILKQMQMAVEDIKSESFYLSQEDLEAKKAVMQDKRKEITFSRKED